jgi:glycosyltransferase involved in cell wall biosynthesis
MYPHVLVYSRDFYSFFTEHCDEFTFTIRIVSLDEIPLLFQCNYALLLTFGDCFIELPERLMRRWIKLPSLDVAVINAHVLDAYMKLILSPQRPVFSIFTTCFHSYDKIKRAYQSVLRQTIDWEWIVLDDSIDEHFGFLQEVLTDPRVRLYKRPHHGFIGNVKQEAVSLCRGEYVLELDHDDEIVPSLLSDAVKAFDDPEVGFVYTDYCNLYENGEPFHYGNYFSLGYGGYYRQFYKGKWIYVAMSPNINSTTLSHIVSIPNHARMWRRKVLLDIGNYNEYLPICDDYELLLRTAVHTKMVRIPKLGYIQYMNDDQNNFSLIRNSEINRLREHLTPLLYEKLNILSVMEQKGALDTSDISLPIWKRPIVYRYCNGIASCYKTYYCILGVAAFHQHYATLKRLYVPENDFLLLDCSDGTILERFKMTRIHYSMESDLAFFDFYKQGPSVVLTAQRIPPIIHGGSPKKLTIITPCTRPGNLMRLKESIPFDHVDQWIIVYDESVTPNAHLFDDARIQEYGCQGHSIAGNIQRNYALDKIGDTYVYFLDDDTIMHPDMSEFLKTVEPNHIYTFDQQRNAKEFPFTEILKGDTIEMFRIDTAMFLIDSSLIQDIRWSVDEYTADAIFITECYSTHPESWIYVDRVLSYYNYLNDFKRKG